jgi:hypothetical protein
MAATIGVALSAADLEQAELARLAKVHITTIVQA